MPGGLFSLLRFPGRILGLKRCLAKKGESFASFVAVGRIHRGSVRSVRHIANHL
jgi:hypothetical protein